MAIPNSFLFFPEDIVYNILDRSTHSLPLPLLSFPVNCSGLHTQTWAPHPLSYSSVYLRTRASTLNPKLAVRQLDLSTSGFLRYMLVRDDGPSTYGCRYIRKEGKRQREGMRVCFLSHSCAEAEPQNSAATAETQGGHLAIHVLNVRGRTRLQSADSSEVLWRCLGVFLAPLSIKKKQTTLNLEQ